MEIHSIFRNSHVIWKFTCYLEIHTIFLPVDENSYLFADKNYTITFDCRAKHVTLHTCNNYMYNLHVIFNKTICPSMQLEKKNILLFGREHASERCTICWRDFFKSCQTTYNLNSPSVSKFVAVFAWRILKYFYIKRNVFYIYLVTNTLSERMINIETVYSNKSEIFAHMNLQ